MCQRKSAPAKTYSVAPSVVHRPARWHLSLPSGGRDECPTELFGSVARSCIKMNGIYCYCGHTKLNKMNGSGRFPNVTPCPAYGQLKINIKHSISISFSVRQILIDITFVQNQICDCAYIDDSCLNQIIQSTWRCNDDADTAFDAIDLCTTVTATVYTDAAEICQMFEMVGIRTCHRICVVGLKNRYVRFHATKLILAHFFFDLQGQFTGGSHDQNIRSLTL